MKNFSILLPFIVILAFAFSNPPVRKVEWVSDTRHDFGVLTHQQPGSHTFVFRNTSSGPLTIDNVRTTCGCTSPQWEETVVMPDSLGQIELEYDAFKLGYFQKFAKVYFSGQKKAEKLVIEGEVIEGD